MSGQVSLRIGASLDEIGHVSAAIEEIGRQDNWPPDLITRINLVVEELVVNTMNHGGDVNEIEMTLTSDDDSVIVEIADDGRPFDPLVDAPEPDFTSPLGDRPIGGLGVHLVRTIMDEMHYRRTQGKNHLALTKRRVE